MVDGFNKLAGAVGKALEVAPDLYDDALKPSAQESGKALSRIPRLINAALSSLDIWILNKEYNVEKTKKLLAKKLENVEPEKIVSPESYVAVPAIQAISYSMNSEELREMYANLLANSMNSDFKDSVHPAFVEIIKQLSPFEANLLKQLSKHCNPLIPIVRIRQSVDNNDSEGLDCFNHILDSEFGINYNNLNAFSVAIDNLIRLELIKVDYTRTIVNKSLYDKIHNSELCLNLKKLINNTDKFNHCLFIDGNLQLSELGLLFTKICIN